jgi:1-deoxy-D-xylulose-5-phosphate reductoisomerase
VLNAADEVAVEAFMTGGLDFTGISRLIEATLTAAKSGLLAEPASLDAALAIDHNARLLAQEILPRIAAKAF